LRSGLGLGPVERFVTARQMHRRERADRIAKWTLQSLPGDWQAQEHRWDLYHWLRTGGLIVVFAMLVLSVGIR
jgi:hypothetical protein